MPRREPEAVFTPKTIATREMFTHRNEPTSAGNPGLQASLRDALRDRGGQVLLHGDTGVGKSSLLKYTAEDEGLPTLIVECLSNYSYDALIEAAVRQIIEVRELTRTNDDSIGAAAEATFGLRALFSLKGTVKAETGQSVVFEVFKQSPMELLLAAMLKANKKIFVIDNFQNIRDSDTRELVAQTMELMSDRASATGDIKTVVIGIGEDAASLIGRSGSYQRRTEEILVPRMPDNEVREILSTGFGLLGMTADTALLDKLVFFSDGFPFFAHLLGLRVAQAVRATNSTSQVITAASIDAGLVRASNGVDSSYSERLRKAVEASGDIQPRRRLMSILANSSQRAWSSSEVIVQWENAYHENRSSYEFLHVALAQLTSDQYGSILNRSGTPRRYIYQFRDPQMRPFLRINLTNSAN